MRKFHVLVHSLLLVTSPSLFAYPQCEQPIVQQIHFQEKPFTGLNLTYDDILRLLQDIEEETTEGYGAQNRDRIAYFLALLAQQGMLSRDYAAHAELNNDIAALFSDETDLSDFACYTDLEYSILPALFYGEEDPMILLCKKKKHKDKHHGKARHHHGHNHSKNVFARVKDFIVKHKKAIIIGAAIVVAATVIIVAVAAASSAGALAAKAASAAGAAAAAASPDSHPHADIKDQRESSSLDIPSEMAAHEIPILKSTLDDHIFSFKENIEQNQFFEATNPTMGQQSLSWEENGRSLGSIFAHDTYHHIDHQIPYNPRLSQEILSINPKYAYMAKVGNQGNAVGHAEIDRKFTTDYGYLYSTPGQDSDFNTLSYQVRGEKALSMGYYNQAVQDLGKAIETNPANPLPYLERGIAHFSLGQYDRSLEDYRQFTSQAQVQKSNPLSVSEFSVGFAKGLPKGVYESGESFLLFMTDFVTHPIHTSVQVVDSVVTLVNLVRNDEWGIVAEALSPEIHQLVTQWETLPSDKKGELAGFAVGKHGADIFAPGALAKVASKSIKSAQELSAVCKNIQIARETLLLETAAEIGNSAKIAEVVRNGQTLMALGEDVGLAAREMAQLKQAGKLEGAINSGLEKLVSQAKSDVLKDAISQNKHVKMVRDYLDKPAKEIQKGVNSYEKQIAIHKDKIANPTKYYPDWDKLDPRQREALINKKWPAEIQGYEEQRNVLQSILNERLSHE